MKNLKLIVLIVLGIFLIAQLTTVVYNNNDNQNKKNSYDSKENKNGEHGTRSGDPDLICEIWSTYGVEFTDHNSIITVRVTNQGSGDATSEIWLKIDKDGLEVFKDIIAPNLDSGMFVDKTMNWDSRIERDYLWDAFADPDNTIFEDDETNNHASVTIGVFTDHSNTGYEDYYHYVGDESIIMWQHGTLVNSINGNLFISSTDLHVSALQYDLDFTRAYNSQRSQILSPMGYGWTHNHDTHLSIQGNGDIIYIDSDGTSHYYTLSGGNYIPPVGVYEKLVKYSGPPVTYKLFNLDGSFMTFDAGGIIQLITDKNGNKLTYAYSGGLLNTVTDDSGLSLTFSYTGNLLTSVVDTAPTPRTVSFVYYGSNELKDVTDPRSNTARYHYDGSSRLTSYADREDTTLIFSYKIANVPSRDRIDEVERAVYDRGIGTSYSIFRMYTFSYLTYKTAVVNADGLDVSSTIKYNIYGNPTSLWGPVIGNRFGEGDYVWVNGRITSYTDPLSFTTIYTFDTYGNKLTESDPLGFTRTWEYSVTDSFGGPSDTYINWKTKYIDKLGHEWVYTYDTKGNMLTVTDPTLVVRSYIYNSLGLVTDDSGPPHVVMTYDVHGNLATITYDDVTNVQYLYNSIGWKTQMTDEDGFVWDYAYDNNGNLVTETDPAPFLYTTNYVYDNENRLTEKTNKQRNTMYITYDKRLCRIDWMEDYESQSTIATYDYASNMLTYVNKNGKTYEFSYDSLNRVEDVTDPNGKKVSYKYDSSSNLASETDRMGNEKKFEYDAVNRRTDTIDELGYVTTTVYDAEGKKISEINARGFSTLYEYDDAGRVTRVTDALGNFETRSYDTLGRLSIVTNKDSTTETYTYDVKSRTQTVTDAVGLTSYTYDGRGNIRTETDPFPRTTQYFYDALSRMTSMISPQGFTTTFSYEVCICSGGDTLVDRVIDANGNQIDYNYDKMGRKTSETTQLGKLTQYFYDGEGNMIKRIDPSTTTTHFDYDNLDRLDKVRYPGIVNIDYTYDDNGNMIRSQNNGIGEEETIDYSYDKKNQLKTVRFYKGTSYDFQTTYDYDEVGNLILMRDPQNGLTRYQYDGLDRMISIVNPYGEITTFEYDNMNRNTKVNYANGMDLSNTFDTRGWLLNQAYGLGIIVLTISYTYDTVGKIKTRTEAGGVTTYTYDLDDRLTNVVYPGSTVGYTYDPVGNRLTMTVVGSPVVNYAYNPDNELGSITQAGSPTITYTYDANGNTATKTVGAGAPTTYSYDFENRLISYVSGTTTANYKYDSYSPTLIYGKGFTPGGSCGSKGIENPTPDVGGRRFSKNVVSGGSTTTYYLYDVSSIIQEYDASWALQAEYTNGPGIDNHISMTRVGISFYYLNDVQGSIFAISDPGQVIVKTYTYDAWGTIVAQTGVLANPFRYTGREFDAESGLYFYRSRNYDTAIGRFLQKDPKGIIDGPNVYAYVINDPVNKMDPFGTRWLWTCYNDAKWAKKKGEDLGADGYWRHAYLGCHLRQKGCDLRTTYDIALGKEFQDFFDKKHDSDTEDIVATLYGWYKGEEGSKKVTKYRNQKVWGTKKVWGGFKIPWRYTVRMPYTATEYTKSCLDILYHDKIYPMFREPEN